MTDVATNVPIHVVSIVILFIFFVIFCIALWNDHEKTPQDNKETTNG